MCLTISKRFEFSSSQRYANPRWSEEQNRAVFGEAMGGKYGYGQNYTAYFVFRGEVNPDNGMVINVTTIKSMVNAVLDSRYDHKYLNGDTRPFDRLIPTPENLAAQLLADVTPLFAGENAKPVACHLVETPWREATAYADGRIESHHVLSFSAARRTHSPNLSDEENEKLFGVAASPTGHGHSYRLRVTLGGQVDSETGMIVTDLDCRAATGELFQLLDHRNLNTDVEQLRGNPMTTEYLSRFIWEYLARRLPVIRVRLHERDDFFAEYLGDSRFRMGIEQTFNAAHRLHSPSLGNKENLELYGKCNNPGGHGHLYRVEATLAAKYDERSGTLFPLGRFHEALGAALDPWRYRHLDLETGDFGDRPSTSENMVGILWRRVDRGLDGALNRLRLWETPNNRFTLRRNVK